MKQLFNNSHYKVLEVSLNKGESMPLHKATSEAFVIVKKGAGKIIFVDREIQLMQGTTQLIPANEQHQLKINEDFTACITLASQAEINFV